MNYSGTFDMTRQRQRVDCDGAAATGARFSAAAGLTASGSTIGATLRRRSIDRRATACDWPRPDDEPRGRGARASCAHRRRSATRRRTQQQVSDEVYAAYSRVFAYDSAAPLNASIDAEQTHASMDSPTHRVRRRVRRRAHGAVPLSSEHGSCRHIRP